MDYQKIEKEHYNLHLINNDKFKHIDIVITYRNIAKKENITKNNFLSYLLSESCGDYKTHREMVLACEDLYSLTGGCTHALVGKEMDLNFHSSMLDPKYAEPKLFEDALRFMVNTIYKPNVVEKNFDQKSFDYVMRALKKEIVAVEERPNAYSQMRLMELMDNDTELSYHSIGYLEDLEKITPRVMYEYYLDVINNNIVDIFVSGNISKYNVVGLIDELFEDIKNPKAMIYPIIEHKTFSDHAKYGREVKKTKQSIMKIGFKTEALDKYERELIIPLYSHILGSGFESKLFQTVREKNSLCYSINAYGKIVSNVLFISAGISAINYDKALALSLEEVNNMALGNITEKEFDTAIISFKTDLEMTTDSLRSITSNYITREFYDAYLPEEKIELLNKIKMEEIVNLAKKIHLDTIFLLEGDDSNA